MKKDVIYIDIEDDITSIIEKVKAAQVKIVALVPPKRIGALQSVVNLKLLQRAAQGVDKRVVLITNDPSLTNLAAGVSIPVAKNLQSKPEIAPISTLEIDDEDIINGEELSIGEHAATAPGAIPIVDEKPSAFTPTPAGPVAALAAANAPKKGPKIPNFDTFRKKIFIFGGLGLALIVFLVWATVFAPRAVIAITAKTTSYDINKALTLSPTATLDADAGSLKAVVKEVQKTNSVDFTATGKKDVGEKATGTITLVNDDTDPVSVPAGSTFTTASGRQFTSDTSVTVQGFRRVLGVETKGTIKLAATAVAIGEEYNVGAQTLVSNDVTFPP
ncbi:baseplate J/gp47 family protein, partial [Pedobacter sp.]|nr:baseplate J/gp47 family protein [Candidatus Saccharibacteria bacterium]